MLSYKGKRLTRNQSKDSKPSSHQPHIQPPSYAPIAKESPKSTMPPRVAPEKEKTEEEEVADIPAWFRKKMM